VGGEHLGRWAKLTAETAVEPLRSNFIRLQEQLALLDCIQFDLCDESLQALT